MSSTAIGLLPAFSSNAISCGVGALIGGRLGDKFGRKRFYNSLDLLLFIVGVLIIVFAANVGMLFAGYIIAGLAVGADVPTSWSLIAMHARSLDAAQLDRDSAARVHRRSACTPHRP
jgi:MFS transporter, SP family, inositol transporter